MASSALLTLPAEIRLAIWKYVVPKVVEVIVPGNCENSQTPGWDYIQLPQNPRLPLLLTNKQVRGEVETITSTMLVVRCHDHYHLDEWLQKSTLHDKSIVGRIRIDDQVIRDLGWEKYPERRAITRDWYVNDFGDSLVCYYRHVKSLGSELTYQYHQGSLDVTFEVGDAHDLKRKWECGRFTSGLPSDTLCQDVTKPLPQTARVTTYKAGKAQLDQLPFEVLSGEVQQYW